MKLNNIIFLGCTQNYSSNFSAANTKIGFLCKGLSELGNSCYINNGLIGSSKIINKREAVKFEQIATVVTYKLRINKLISPFLNISYLYTDLKQSYLNKCRNIVILEFPDLHIYIIYCFLCRLLGYKILVISHEWSNTVDTTHILRRPFNWIYSKIFGYFSDGILPISEYIISKVKRFNKPLFKLPVTADFCIEADSTASIKNNYFLYCVYADYSRVIDMIINSFEQYRKLSNKNKLILVLSGSESKINMIKNQVQLKTCAPYIFIKTNLSYFDLFNLYAHAKALLVPLNPNHEQDKARFSQKIAEYLSSGSPIITNNVGEINYYFTDKKNVILSHSFTSEAYCETFLWTDNHDSELKEIGSEGKKIGRLNFDYRKQCSDLNSFIIKYCS